MSDEGPEAAKIFGGFFLNLMLAFVLGLLAGFLAKAIGTPDAWVMRADLAVFFIVLIVDPIDLWRRKVPLERAAIKLGLAAGVAALILFLLPDGENFTDASAGEAEVGGAEPEEGKDAREAMADAIWIILPMFAILPLMFLLPFAERLIVNRKAPREDAAKDVQIALIFPIFVTFHMMLHLGILGALFLLDASLLMAFGILTLGVLLVVAETFAAGEDELIENTEHWGPRPETAKEAWTGLGKAVRNSLASGLFIAATMYLSLKAGLPYFMDTDVDAFRNMTFVIDLLKGIGIMMLAMVFLTILGNAVVALAVLTLMRMKGLDPLTTTELVKQSSARLFVGGMNFVRPDLPSD